MANMAVSRIKREFREVIKSEEVSGRNVLYLKCMLSIDGAHSMQPWQDVCQKPFPKYAMNSPNFVNVILLIIVSLYGWIA